MKTMKSNSFVKNTTSLKCEMNTSAKRLCGAIDHRARKLADKVLLPLERGRAFGCHGGLRHGDGRGRLFAGAAFDRMGFVRSLRCGSAHRLIRAFARAGQYPVGLRLQRRSLGRKFVTFPVEIGDVASSLFNGSSRGRYEQHVQQHPEHDEVRDLDEERAVDREQHGPGVLVAAEED